MRPTGIPRRSASGRWTPHGIEHRQAGGEAALLPRPHVPGYFVWSSILSVDEFFMTDLIPVSIDASDSYIPEDPMIW